MVGPFRLTKQLAKEALEEKLENLQQKTIETTQQKTIGPNLANLIFERLSGPWKRSIAPTTMELYDQTVFPIWIDFHWIGDMDPKDIDKDRLAAYREDLFEADPTVVRDPKTKAVKSVTFGKLRKTPRNARTVERYESLVHKYLKEMGNHAPDDVAVLKKAPVLVHWLERKDLQDYLNTLQLPQLQLAATMLLHGFSASEACGVEWDSYDGSSVTVSQQDQMILGKKRTRTDLKRPRRFRTVPITDSLKAKLDALPHNTPRILMTETGRTFSRWTLRQALMRKCIGTKWAAITPHDLRRSGGKWMLDNGSKLNDVAAILGNDVKVLLLHYDVADKEGMVRAVQALG